MAEKADGTTAPPPPRRGKFLSGPPPSVVASTTTAATSPPPAKSQTRGKFLNSSSAPNKSSSTSTDGTSTSTTGETSLSTLKQQIHQTRLVASTRRRAISSSRDEIFNDLEEAETIVLALLQCASEVSESLSKMTMARSRNQIDIGDGDNNNGSTNNGDAALSFEQLSAQVRLNGVGYLAGVTKLHELLAPHASLVKSYRNHTSTASGAASNADNKAKNDNAQGAASSSDATSKNSSEIASFNPNSSEIVNMATSNMYAARVEKRLAVERREILKEMIRLEEEGLQGSGEKEEEASTLSNNKRKR